MGRLTPPYPTADRVKPYLCHYKNKINVLTKLAILLIRVKCCPIFKVVNAQNKYELRSVVCSGIILRDDIVVFGASVPREISRRLMHKR